MPIAVRCTNIVRYDPEQGKYIHCGHKFAVKDELAGRRVRCPKCGGEVEAPQASPASASKAAPDKAAARPASPSQQSKPKSRQPIADSRQPTASSRQPIADSRPPSSAAPSDDNLPELLDEDDDFRLSDPVEKPKMTFPGLDVPAAPPARPTPTPPPPPGDATEQTADEKAPCPECGRPVSVRSVICTSCGYHKGLQRRVDAFEDVEDEEKVVGFERWLRRQLVEGDDPNAVRSLLIVSGLFLVAGGACLFLAIGHLVWIFVAAAAVIAAGAWLGWFRPDPWQWLLFVNRMSQWRDPKPPFSHRKVLDLRNMQISDEELASLQNLSEFQVLDLEGTAITDQGLPALYDYRNLQYIVLRDTQTTEQGAARLQQALPNAWIWR